MRACDVVKMETTEAFCHRHSPRKQWSKEVERMVAITPIKIQVASKETENPATFSFSHSWYEPLLVLILSSGKISLLNVPFLVAEEETVCEDLLPGFPLLRHLVIGSRIPLEQNWGSLGGRDCAGIDGHQTPSAGGRFGRLILAQMERNDEEKSNEPLSNRPRANYFDHQHPADPFPDPFLLDVQDEAAEDAQSRKDIEELLACAKAESFPEEH